MRNIVTRDYYFKVSRYSGGSEYDDIFFEANEQIEDFPESVIELKNEIESFVKVASMLFKSDHRTYELYYEKLFMLADLAFNGKKEQTFLARNSLDSLKRELVHEIGPRIRTTLLFKYIRLSIFPVLLLCLFSSGLHFFDHHKSFDYVLKLMLVAVGANVGCWLSLAVRTRGVEFEQILPILSDQKGVLSRIIFVMTFSIVMAILMKSGLLSIKLGEFSSETIQTHNYSALTAGFIMGFAEKLFIDKFQSKINTVKV
ncbi:MULTISPECIES: hypothetical protein [Vibrio]|uniref:Uncharacterized protein n=1 Tax=Vibrio splendidus TaxID=29497 RepID=A0A2T5ELT6_VIBSP|nr:MULTISPECIES: hypothetical protein [Vibrio]OEE64797.1 hypothetical protein A147_17300 [Vibrio splendidus FF-6]PMM09440.1 hypothetical protein BCT62_12810 [Vibrio splendidus]PTP21713.1 hypothetical protein CWO36_05175 [Vibrio splendidus]ROR14127.1 hypothetical protein EDB36_107125 [Vibrio crassostreae]CAK2136863.1 conserved membrane hypothetical protein [Vibrio crassostreae]